MNSRTIEPDALLKGAAALIICACVLAGAQESRDPSLLLKIGDPRLKDKVLEVFPGELYCAETGKTLSFDRMIQDMRGCQLVYIGETHNSLPMHELQSRILQALYGQDRNLALGLEMFPATFQDVLNRWSLGILAEDEFIRESLWYVNWNLNFGFYRDIFIFAKENKIPVYGLNAPRDIITKIRMSGWEALSESEKAIVPKPDLGHPEHRELIRKIFESAEIPHQMKGAGLDAVFEGLYRAQSAWDEVMAANALEALRKERKKVVVLAGSGHLLYNLGINRRAFEKSRLPSKTVIAVSIPKEEKSITVARSLADYIFSLPEEDKPAYPSIGLAFKKVNGLENLVIESTPIDGAALGQDFEKGDVVLFVDGKPFTEINELRIYLSKFAWGDEVKFKLLRGGQEKDVPLKLSF
jgi:uncharacterized iron-regulated protein